MAEDLRRRFAEDRSYVFDAVDVAGPRHHLAHKTAELADDVPIVRVKNMFVAAIESAIGRHDQKGTMPLIGAFLNNQLAVHRLSFNERGNPRW